jgi:hypothetical protein
MLFDAAVSLVSILTAFALGVMYGTARVKRLYVTSRRQ